MQTGDGHHNRMHNKRSPIGIKKLEGFLTKKKKEA